MSAIEASVDQSNVRSLPLRGLKLGVTETSYQTYPRSESAADRRDLRWRFDLIAMLIDHEAHSWVTALVQRVTNYPGRRWARCRAIEEDSQSSRIVRLPRALLLQLIHRSRDRDTAAEFRLSDSLFQGFQQIVQGHSP
jgi:hypothetical protein